LGCIDLALPIGYKLLRAEPDGLVFRDLLPLRCSGGPSVDATMDAAKVLQHLV